MCLRWFEHIEALDSASISTFRSSKRWTGQPSAILAPQIRKHLNNPKVDPGSFGTSRKMSLKSFTGKKEEILMAAGSQDDDEDEVPPAA